jgi:hypothetical protein
MTIAKRAEETSGSGGLQTCGTAASVGAPVAATPNHGVPSAPLFLREKAEPGFGELPPGDLEVRIAAALGHAKAHLGILLQLGQGRHGADPGWRSRFLSMRFLAECSTGRSVR